MLVREILGFLAGLSIMCSYMFDGKVLRAINIFGSILFVIYGIMLRAYSVIALNIGATILNLYYILKEEK